MSSSSGARGDRREQVAAIVGVLLMPLLIAGTFLWATADSSSRLHEQQAAIVNLDAGARVGDDTVRLGQTYALQPSQDGGLMLALVTTPPASATAVPSLGTWALGMLSALLAGCAALIARRRRTVG